ncbi:MAG: hypothetical protein ACR2RE_13300 [Geminicoccaceae bacterium]
MRFEANGGHHTLTVRGTVDVNDIELNSLGCIASLAASQRAPERQRIAHEDQGDFEPGHTVLDHDDYLRHAHRGKRLAASTA